VEVQRWVADTRGTYWIVGSYGRCEPLSSSTSKNPHELVLEALEAEEDMELENSRKKSRGARKRTMPRAWTKVLLAQASH
jgi:hypothetical protein